MEKFLKMCDLKSYYQVCDVGTGTGVVAQELSKYCSIVYAIDSSPEMLQIAKRKRWISNVKYMHINAEKMLSSGFKEGMFDCVTARMVFHHVENQKKAIKECYKILKPNGLFVISDGIPPQGARKFYTEVFKLKEKRRTYLIDDITDLLEYANFRNIKISLHVMESVSINTWLDNSGLSKDICKKIYNLHLDSPDYIKKAYNMKILNGDIFMDWIFVIVSAER